MATMEYDGFIATIDYDSESDSFMGNVINISSPITFYGQTTKELKQEFAKSVTIWREVCKEKGIQPEKPYSGRMTIRMSPEIHRTIVSVAAQSGKSVNSWVVESLLAMAEGKL